MSQRKCKSVFELAHYAVGDMAWWVVMRPMAAMEAIPDADSWMEEHHPKTLFLRGPGRHIWRRGTQLPRLQHLDFQCVIGLLTSRLVVEEFQISDIIRCRNTGEFFYANGQEEWMPEAYLCDSEAAARREKSRIMRMLRKWAID